MKGSKLSLKEANGIAYTPQLLDKIYYSSIKDSALYMFTRDRLDDQWGEAKQVQGLEDFGYDQITPFVLTDGATLYFAAKGEESLGGYFHVKVFARPRNFLETRKHRNAV